MLSNHAFTHFRTVDYVLRLFSCTFDANIEMLKIIENIFRSLIFASLVCIFLWQANIAFEKYKSKQTYFQESVVDEGTLLYPSISFCTVNIWDTYPGVLQLIKNNETNFDILKTFAKTHYWDVRKMFLFVSHSNIVNAESYPCNTVGGPGFGRPCKFPCIYQQVGEKSF